MSDLQTDLQSALGDAYQIEREIGGGGMSRLFLASEASLNRQVVIKLLPPEMTSEVSAARFKKEIELAAQLQHPNILPVLTAGADGELIYYVMPYVAGESLRHRLTTEGRMSIEDGQKILAEVADALAFAHAQGVVHRDIKPDNVLLQHGHAVLTDFGVARAVVEAQGGERLTQTGMAVGTPGYMSPEQAAGETHIDARADVYSLAVVGYELFTGEQPFTGASMQAILAAHMTETPKTVVDVRSDVPNQVSDAIAKALEKDPRERLQTAAEFRDAVGMVRSGTIEASRPRVLAPVIATVLTVAAVAAFFLWPRGWSYDGDPRESLIVFPFENRTGDDDRDWLEEASMNLLALSLSHWEDLRVFDDERTASLMRRRDVEDAADLDFDAAQRMAQEANVGTLVIGDIRREGADLAVEAKVHDVETGDRLATEIVRAPIDDDPRALFDSLSSRVLEISGAPPGQSPGVIAQTTNSVEAYRGYLRGSEYMQRFELDSARVHLERAVALDSGFALAYIQLRNTEGWAGVGGDPDKRRAYVSLAETHSANLPPRLKSLIQFHTAYESGDLRRARGIAEQMLARDSTDVEAWFQLGEAHFHHRPGEMPHADSLGNYGRALRAFERTLALDSSYVLAYLHITNTLLGCSQDVWPFLCLADSAAYGTADEFNATYGASEVARIRQESADRLIEAHYAWVTEVPDAERPRLELTQSLIIQQRYVEAEAQAERLREMGDSITADILRARSLYGQREFAAATALASETFNATSMEDFRIRWGTLSPAIPILEAGGRSRQTWTEYRRFFDVLPIAQQTVPNIVGNNVTLPFALIAQLMDSIDALNLPTGYYFDQAQARHMDSVVIGVNRAWFPDSADYVANAILTCQHPYYIAKDTAALATWIAFVPDTLCPAQHASLALARGDTATASVMADRASDALPDDPTSWDQNTAQDAFISGDLLASLGRTRDALDMFARLDSVSWLQTASPMIRAWAERAALHQTLGEQREAIALYEDVLEALSEADETLEPFLDRVRAALAAAHGETQSANR